MNPVIGWRRALHRLAEPAFQEEETAAFVVDALRGLGLDVATDVGGGVIGTLDRGGRGLVYGFRADMDALPIQEETGLAWASVHPGAMHACGHDGHMAMVLGAAAALAADPDWAGAARFVFQPAEEPGKGAAAMIADGLFERFHMDAMFGLHNLPGLAAGRLATRPGPIMAGEDDFTITLTGRGGHASSPHLVRDPLVAAGHVLTSLQTIVSRSVDPLASVVVSATDLTTDGARNAIPTHVTITGDARVFTPSMSGFVEERMRKIVEHTASAHGVAGSLEYTREFAPAVNSVDATEVAIAAARDVAGEAGVDPATPPIMASEDFGLYAEHVPAAFAFLGNGIDSVPLHSHDYDLDESILETGVRYYVALARRAARSSPSGATAARTTG